MTPEKFSTDKYAVIKGFIDPDMTSTVSRYMEYAFAQGAFVRAPDPVTTSFFIYADPLIETLLYNCRGKIEGITGKQLYPTYSYARLYFSGDALKPHTDRAACEYSVTVNVANVGESWPMWVHAPDADRQAIVLEPGDAIVYKGCEVVHWRQKAEDNKITAQFMLHYVDQNGESAKHKWDMRPSLGIPLHLRTGDGQ